MPDSQEDEDASPAGFARQQARTRRFSLGVPRKFTVSPGGERVVFLRSPAGDDPVARYGFSTPPAARNGRWRAPVPYWAVAKRTCRPKRGHRRERSRELAGGIVDYACDEHGGARRLHSGRPPVVGALGRP